MSVLDEFKTFVTTLTGTSTYKNWCAKSPGDCTRWKTYSQAILAGQTPSTPTMTTGFGKALVQVGAITLTQKPSVGGYGVTSYGQGDYSLLTRIKLALRGHQAS